MHVSRKGGIRSILFFLGLFFFLRESFDEISLMCVGMTALNSPTNAEEVGRDNIHLTWGEWEGRDSSRLTWRGEGGQDHLNTSQSICTF